MKNRIGFHMNYFRGTSYEYDIISAANRIKQAGGNAIELMPEHLYMQSKRQFDEFKATIRDMDIELIVGAGRSPETDASSEDQTIREQSYRMSLKVLKMIHELGGNKWDGLIHAAWPGRPPGILSKEKKQIILDRCAEEMRRILPVADDYGIDFCFEAVNRFEHYLINTAQEAIDFCCILNHPRAKILLDTFHMNIEEDSIRNAIRAVSNAGNLKHFHISEANRSVPGTIESHLNWNSIFMTLAECQYNETIILEPFLICGVPFSNTAAVWRDQTRGQSFSDFLNNIDIGVAFVKNHLKLASTMPDTRLP